MGLHINSKLLSTALVALLSTTGLAGAQAVEEFYKGNTVTLVISAAPGGSADIFGRAFADYFAKHIPGQPRIVVTNQAGAGGIVAAARLQNTAPKDGTVVAVLQRNNLYLPLVSDKKIDFDPQGVNWIGSIAKETQNVLVWEGAPVQKADDLFKTELRIGATSFANENATLPMMMNEYFGTKFDIVVGYEGNEAIGLAMERGEVSGRILAGIPETEAGLIKAGKLKVVMQVGTEADPAFPDAPTLVSFSQDPEAIELAGFMLAPMAASRPLAAPAGVPEDRLAALRTAFDATTTDPDFIAHMQRLNMPVSPINGPEVELLVDKLYAASPAVLEKVKKLLNPK